MNTKFLTLSLLIGITSALPATPPDPSTPITVTENRTIIPKSGLTAMGLENFDAHLPLIKLGPQDYWMYLSEGGKTDGKHSHVVRFKTDLGNYDPSTLEQVEISGIPDANVNEFNGWKAWLTNLHSFGGDEWLAILHFENQDNGVKELFRQGPAYSSDGGRTFKFLGFNIAPQLPDEVIQRGRSSGLINLAGGGFRVDQTYAYMYFSDMNREDRRDRHIAVARAPLDALLRDARAGRNTLWFKYHDGAWNEPGLGGASANLGDGLGEYHTSIAYNTYVDQWITFTTKNGYLVMRRSRDPLDFNVPDERVCALPPGAKAAYFTIQSLNHGMEECGRDFYLYYRLDPGDHKSFDTIRLTLSFGETRLP